MRIYISGKREKGGISDDTRNTIKRIGEDYVEVESEEIKI